MSSMRLPLTIFALGCLLAADPASAQSGAALDNPLVRGSRAPADLSLGEWRKHCFTTREQKQLCRTTRNASLKTGQELFRIDFVTEDGQPATRVEVKVPSGVFLPPGIALGVEGGVQAKIPYLTCLSNICEASDVVSAAFMEALKSGSAITVTVSDINLLSVSLQIPLGGLTSKLSGAADETFDMGLQRR